MKFKLTAEQVGFASSITNLMQNADSIKVAREWASGNHQPGLELWEKLTELGLPALIVPEAYDGLAASWVDLAVAFEVLGHEIAVGPWIESTAYLATALGAQAAEIAAGAIFTVAEQKFSTYAEATTVSTKMFVVTDAGLFTGTPVDSIQQSLDTTRQLQKLTAEAKQIELSAELRATAQDAASLATAAELLGAGTRILTDAVAYVKQRRQFGREIGSYQAIKHQLAEVQIGLDFARPLIFGAALTQQPVDISAAKVAANQAANKAARVGLQVHGAIGYTAECDLSLWILRIRALVNAWGTSNYHRSRILDQLAER